MTKLQSANQTIAILETKVKNLSNELEKYHGMVHDICYNFGKGDTDKAKEELKQLDLMLHDSVEYSFK